MRSAFEEPMTVHAINGDVVITGPDAIGVSLTPAAAEESARRLTEAAEIAREGGERVPSVDD